MHQKTQFLEHNAENVRNAGKWYQFPTYKKCLKSYN